MFRSTKPLKLLVVSLLGIGFVVGSGMLPRDRALASVNYTVEELAGYRTWTKVTKELIQGAPNVSTIDVVSIGGG